MEAWLAARSRRHQGRRGEKEEVDGARVAEAEGAIGGAEEAGEGGGGCVVDIDKREQFVELGAAVRFGRFPRHVGATARPEFDSCRRGADNTPERASADQRDPMPNVSRRARALSPCLTTRRFAELSAADSAASRSMRAHMPSTEQSADVDEADAISLSSACVAARATASTMLSHTVSTLAAASHGNWAVRASKCALAFFAIAVCSGVQGNAFTMVAADNHSSYR